MAAVSPTPSSKLFVKSDNVVLSQDRFIECKTQGSWYQIGIDHVLKSNETTTFSIKYESDNVMIGVAAKGVINTNGYSGQFMYGWAFGNGGNKYHFGQYSKYGLQQNILSHSGSFKWATGDQITLKHHNYTLTLLVNSVQVNQWELRKYPNLDAVDLYPTINLRDGKAELVSLSVE